MGRAQDEPTAGLTRRDFLQATGAGLALGGVPPALLRADPAPGAASEFAVRVERVG